MTAYGLDKVIDLAWKSHESAQRETTLKEQLDGKGK